MSVEEELGRALALSAAIATEKSSAVRTELAGGIAVAVQNLVTLLGVDVTEVLAAADVATKQIRGAGRD